MLNPLVQVLVVAAFVLAGAPVTGTDATPGVAMSPRVVRIAIDLKLDPPAGLIHERAEVTIAGSGVKRLVFRLDHALVVETWVAAASTAPHKAVVIASGREATYLAPRSIHFLPLDKDLSLELNKQGQANAAKLSEP